MKCPGCNGEGKVICSCCLGTRTKNYMTMTLIFNIPLFTACIKCGETGKEPCTRCGGSGQIPDK